MTSASRLLALLLVATALCGGTADARARHRPAHAPRPTAPEVTPAPTPVPPPAATVPSQDPKAKGFSIAKAAKERDRGFSSFRSEAKMVLRDRSGTTNARDFITLAHEVAGDGDETSIEFATPLDIRGMTVLTHAHADRDDDQWLYLPAAARTRRITSGSRSGSFAGSEFSYEDLVGAVVEKYSYLWLRDEPCPGAAERTCFVNEQRPLDPESGYSRMVAWIDSQDYRAWQVQYYDRSGSQMKTLVSSDFKLFENRFWRPMAMVMTNHINGKSTEMRWSSYNFKINLTSDQMASFSLGQ